MWARSPCPTEAPAHPAPDTVVFVFSGPWSYDENEQVRPYLDQVRPYLDPRRLHISQQVSLLIGLLTLQ